MVSFSNLEKAVKYMKRSSLSILALTVMDDILSYQCRIDIVPGEHGDGIVLFWWHCPRLLTEGEAFGLLL